MKNLFKPLLIAIILSVGIVLFGYSMYKSSVLDNLTEKDNLMKKRWGQFISNKNQRNQLIINHCKVLEVQKELKDSLLLSLQLKFKDEDTIYKTTNFKSFIINEYDINRFIMKSADLTLSKNEELTKLKADINLLNNRSNMLISDYNSRVMDYNKYRSTFPNFFIARNHKLKNIKFFELKYGEENKDPKEKSDIEKWIETGDPVYLEKKQE